MEFFFTELFGVEFFKRLFDIAFLLMFPLIPYLFLLVIQKAERYYSLKENIDLKIDDLESLKKKWDMLGATQKRKIKAYIGLDGIGIEHDNRGDPYP